MEIFPIYVEVILPVPLQGFFTYGVQEAMISQVKPGMRVELEFGKKKKYSGLIYRVIEKTNWQNIKPILSIIDESPILHPQQIQMWEWLAHYYMCPIGEVMMAALPASLRLESETKVYRLLAPAELPLECSDEEYLILEALDLRNELSLHEIQLIVQKQHVLKIIKNMLDKNWISVREELADKKNVSQTSWIRIWPILRGDKQRFNNMLDQIQRSEKQTRSILTYLQHKPNGDWIKRKDLHTISITDSKVTDTLIKKEIYEELILDKYQLPEDELLIKEVRLSTEQQEALLSIKENWNTHQNIVLKGVTGSGKTLIYLQLIKEMLEQDKQVLFLVPEIALTTQLVKRLREYLGEHLLEYHSDLSQNARLSVWHAAMRDTTVIVGARSSIFLPFDRLGLIIVDEEHDSSYKQIDPAPRYHARDAAIIMAGYFNAKVLLGSATPSLESHYNVLQGKYSEVKLDKRYGQSVLPKIEIISIKEAQQYGTIKGFFTKALLDAIQTQFENKKQVIIFRNRRGYSPLLQCINCHWEAICSQCDVRMTLHKYHQKLKCHVCGLQKPIPSSCPQCSQHSLRELGFGTEKIEEELQQFFPEKVIKRFDLDIARSRKIQTEIIQEFEDGEIHALVGTQMITKGLDFTNVGLVGIIQADQIINYPDFRAHERAYQLFTQVGGRSGRREEQGLVMIQAYQIGHHILQDVLNHNDSSFYERELLERRKFNYPPFVRMIKIELRHLKLEKVEEAAGDISKELKKIYGRRVLGPSEPQLSKIKGSYIREIILKLEKNKEIFVQAKEELYRLSNTVKNKQGFSTLRILYHVDPY